MFDDVIQLPRARFRMRSEDPSFQVLSRGVGRFLLSGEVSQDPTTDLEVDTPSGDFEVPLAFHSRPMHAVMQLERSLPRDVVLMARENAEGVEVQLTEAVLPAAKLPRLRVLTTDLVQRVRQLDENRIEFQGAVGADCHLTVLCESKRCTIVIPQGCSATTTAARVGASMPHGYRALVDGAIVSVFKDADFFELVA